MIQSPQFEQLFAGRMQGVPRSFIREILKASLDPEVISFAGGLPNPLFFPVEEIRQASDEVFREFGAAMLQYGTSEGDETLRRLISERYMHQHGLKIGPERIIITNGSQQGIDLLAKALLDPGDRVLMERPGYLGAIQSLSMYSVNFVPVTLDENGLNIDELEKSSARQAKLLYCVPNFQNPSGISYPEANRQQVADVAQRNGFVIVEDDPYGELRFSGTAGKSLAHYLPEQTVLLGSFSKVVAPGIRLGWVAAPDWLHEKLLIAKQASDLHTSGLGQKVLCRYLQNHDINTHIEKIRVQYKRQYEAMAAALAEHFPASLRFTRPEGGMFMWGILPDGLDSQKFFEEAVKEKVVFVPGTPFYTGSGNYPGFRLNFSCVDPATVGKGVERLARALQRIL